MSIRGTLTPSIGAPVVIGPPAFTLSTNPAGGTLAPGTYTYQVVSVAGMNRGSVASPPVSIVVPAGTNTNTVTVTLAPVNGVDPTYGYFVYGRVAGAAGFLGATTGTTFVDGGGTAPGVAPPTTNTSAAPPGTDSQNAPGWTAVVLASTARAPEAQSLAAVGRGQVSVT